ncbi:hypothetical protein SUGI_0870140 [Cryptomeria japonica]|nr:hypothetical protein SUGI_0870140 [Cryptomeria japonica]
MMLLPGIGGSMLNSFDDLQKVAEGTTSVRTKGNGNDDVVEVVRSTCSVLGNVNVCNVMLDSTFNSRLREFNLSCWLEHAVRRCEDNGLSVLSTSLPFPTNFLPLFETVASAVSEVSIGVCEMEEGTIPVRVRMSNIFSSSLYATHILGTILGHALPSPCTPIAYAVESKLNDLKRNHGAVVEREEELEESEVERDPNGISYSFGPKISDWDEQQREWLKKNRRFPNFLPNGRTCILLVTRSAPKECENPLGDHLFLKSIKNKIYYFRLHGIDIFYNMAYLDSKMSRFWAKLPLY